MYVYIYMYMYIYIYTWRSAYVWWITCAHSRIWRVVCTSGECHRVCFTVSSYTTPCLCVSACACVQHPNLCASQHLQARWLHLYADYLLYTYSWTCMYRHAHTGRAAFVSISIKVPLPRTTNRRCTMPYTYMHICIYANTVHIICTCIHSITIRTHTILPVHA